MQTFHFAGVFNFISHAQLIDGAAAEVINNAAAQ
jgi:hypothetical protein